jgi:hypothetical protein
MSHFITYLALERTAAVTAADTVAAFRQLENSVTVTVILTVILLRRMLRHSRDQKCDPSRGVGCKLRPQGSITRGGILLNFGPSR